MIGHIAQLAEHGAYTSAVPGSSPGVPIFFAKVVQWQNAVLVRLKSRVRFPPLAHEVRQ